MEENKSLKQSSKNVGDMVIDRLNELSTANFHLPKDFDAVTAIKMSMLKLQDLKDKNGKSALEVCTSGSIQSALFKMCCYGLNIALNQAYPIVRGNVLCIDPSYFGHVLMVKRIFPEWEPEPRVIREGDVFEYEIEPKNLRRRLIKHEQKLENMDKDFIGGYIMLPTNDGEGSLYIMTKKQILAAWSKSSNQSMSTHKQFDEKMIGKTLINSGCNTIINSTPNYSSAVSEEEAESTSVASSNNVKQIEPEYVEYQEVQEEVASEVESYAADEQQQSDAPNKVKPEPKKQSAKQVPNEDEEEF